MSLARFACVTAVVATASGSVAQDYILRPGPRGFDPRLNRYGVTEEPPQSRTATTDDVIDADTERFNPAKTTVRVELLMTSEGGGLAAQEWSRTLEEIGYPARTRRPLRGDEVGVEQTTQGPLRFVTVVGAIDRRGNLVFADRSFGRHEASELKDWLDSLKTYGAQGSPAGQPLWGLSRAQFEAVYQALSQPITEDVAGRPLAEALDALAVPTEFPLHASAAATPRLGEPGAVVSRSVAGLTLGTGLAFLLNERGLGFRPERTPEGRVVLAVAPLAEHVDARAGTTDATRLPQYWPVGWTVEESGGTKRDAAPVKDRDAVPPNRVQIAPSLFTMTEIGFENVPLSEALTTIETSSGVPVLLDRAGIAAAGIDLAKARVKLDPRKTSWSLALRYAAFPNRLQYELRHDEAGNPLVWIAPIRR